MGRFFVSSIDTNGLFTSTIATGNTVSIAPSSLSNPFIGDTSVWVPSGGGGGWSASGDQVTMDNTAGSDNYLTFIYGIQQTTVSPVTFRLKASGSNIPASAGNAFSIQLILTNINGQGGTILGTSSVNFPSGTFTEQQFSVTVTPTAPAYYLYAYIFAQATGSITVWDGEVYEENATIGTYGTWTSDTIDLAQTIHAPIAVNGITTEQIGFYYGDLSNVDNLNSASHSIEQLSKFTTLVCPPSSGTTTRQQYVYQQLILKGVKLFGYQQVGAPSGSTAPTLSEIETTIQACQTAGYYGIFLDMFGYDFGVTRTTQNDVVTYAHGIGMKCFVNAWNPPDALGSVVNATYNPTGVAPVLNNLDWYLFESFYSASNDEYAGVALGGFINALEMYQGGVSLAQGLGVSTCGLAYQLSTTAITDDSEWIKAYVLAASLGINALCYTSTTTSNNLPWNTPPVFPPLGSSLTSSLVQVSESIYEATVPEGKIQFVAVDNPVSRSYNTYEVDASYTVQIGSVPKFTATRTDILYESSPDKTTWTNISDSLTTFNCPARYLRMSAYLRTT